MGNLYYYIIPCGIAGKLKCLNFCRNKVSENLLKLLYDNKSMSSPMSFFPILFISSEIKNFVMST